ncbi:MAG: hypothetical protein P4L93_03990 [Coriobacteriia bacterium]|nr:hypothetical protein [Coriobacteriia bacterium]
MDRTVSRNQTLLWIFGIEAVAAVLMGVLSLRMGQFMFTAIWVALALVTGTRMIWGALTPYIVMNRDSMALNVAPVRRGLILPWRAILRADRVGDSRIDLTMASGQRVKLSLRAMDRREIESVASEIDQRIRTAQTA